MRGRDLVNGEMGDLIAEQKIELRCIFEYGDDLGGRILKAQMC